MKSYVILEAGRGIIVSGDSTRGGGEIFPRTRSPLGSRINFYYEGVCVYVCVSLQRIIQKVNGKSDVLAARDRWPFLSSMLRFAR